MPARKPSAADMVEHVGTVEQRLPRRKPSLPAVAMEGTTKGRAKPSVEPFATPQRQHVVEENTHVGAGTNRSERRLRATTAVERLYHSGSITWEEYTTGGVVRNRVLTALGGSEGVGPYDLPHGSGAPWAKGDRRAEAISRASGNTHALGGLLYAMTGFATEDGVRVFDQELATLVIRACIETTDGVSLADIGKARSEYANGSKQQLAAGAIALREALRRGAAHLRYAKAVEWRDAKSWRVVEAGAK
jgi:hypothetical protein